jgi:hypothetical protein
LKTITSMLTVIGLATGLFVTQAGSAATGPDTATHNAALDAPVPNGMIRGKVLETMDSGGYTYVFIETDKDKRWVATREMVVKVGDVVQTSPGMVMNKFTSGTLNRTFDVVYFVDVVQNLSAPSEPAVPSGDALPAGHPGMDGAVAAMAADPKVAELKPGENIAYVYANKDALAGQQVSLRGKVVKYNGNIMGRNWLHIRDGSGNAADGTNDLTVTSNATTAVGETVVVTGTIVLDKDFSAGYSYPVMMEDAGLKAE